MKIYSKIISLILCVLLLIGVVGCKAKDEKDTLAGAESKVSNSEVSSTMESSSSEKVKPQSSETSSVSSKNQSSSKKQVPSSVAASSKKVSAASKNSATTNNKTASNSNKTYGTLDKAAYKRLEGLSNKSRGWGQGTTYDDKNRPKYAVDAQKNYGRYNADYVFLDRKEIYLTFDEGYENGYTSKILDTLKAKNVKAVFFITMDYAKSNASLVKRMINEGHIVGNHSTKHKSFPTLSIEKAYDDVKTLHDYIKKNFNYEMKLFRFPMGEYSDRMAALLQEMGYKSVFWSFAYHDWDEKKQPDQAKSLKKITERAHPGAIYLLHAVSKTNTEILSKFIDNVRSSGYEFGVYPA